MGWTGTHFYKDIKTVADKKEALDLEFKDSVIASAIVNNVYYSAMRRHDGKIFAMVTLINVDNSDYFNLRYKDMDESMCPCYYDCPKYIMKLLSDTEYEYAKEWRERVKKAHSKPKVNIKVGDKVKFDTPITFEDGRTIDTFTVAKYYRRFVFESEGKLYRIPKYKDKKFEIIY